MNIPSYKESFGANVDVKQTQYIIGLATPVRHILTLQCICSSGADSRKLAQFIENRARISMFSVHTSSMSNDFEYIALLALNHSGLPMRFREVSRLVES